MGLIPIILWKINSHNFPWTRFAIEHNSQVWEKLSQIANDYVIEILLVNDYRVKKQGMERIRLHLDRGG